MRKNDVLGHSVGNAISILFFSASVFAQTPPREPFPFDWLRPDAAPSSRTLSPAVFPTPQDIPAPAPVESAVAAVETAPAIPQVEPPTESTPQGNIVPAPPAPHAAERPKTKPILNEIDVTNARILTLVEFKLVSTRDETKPFVIKPALQTGKSLKVEVPIVLGCAFTVHLEFTDGTPEQHEGVNLCNDKKINLIE